VILLRIKILAIMKFKQITMVGINFISTSPRQILKCLIHNFMRRDSVDNDLC
jgi:hypothetical protein